MFRTTNRCATALLSLAVFTSSLAWSTLSHAETEQARAEKRLVEILAQIERREINEAFRAVTELTEEVPNFRAAQLLYADMLRLRTGATPMGEQLGPRPGHTQQAQHGRRRSGHCPAGVLQGPEKRATAPPPSSD